MSAGGSPAAAYRYRFADVVIEPRGRRVFVGARERCASKRAFDLLLTLCEAPGRVLSRDELSERLWPGGQIVSDEALTQAIFRARAVLGAQGERIVTVRGVGIRFDADVRRESAVAAPACNDDASTGTAATAIGATGFSATAQAVPGATAAATDTGHAGPTPSEPDARTVAGPPAPAVQIARAADRNVKAGRPRRLGMAAALLVAVVALAAWLLRSGTPAAVAWVDEGYGIRTADVHAAHDDGARLLGEALRHDAGGDRARARALLEALDDSDPRTPWPSLLMGLWAVGAGDDAEAQRWLARARERGEALRDPYFNAVLRYAEAEREGSAAAIIRYAGAVLDLRPRAWRMHLARAHIKYYQGLREAALAEIEQIEIPALGNRKLEAALADRASFGDVAGAQAILDRLPRTADATAWDYLAGRIAWSRGDRRAARAAWERAVTEARRSGRTDIASRAQANAGLAAILDGDDAAAIDHFERARIGMAEAGWVNDEVDLSLLLAQLHALDGDAAAARKEYERALAVGRRNGDGSIATLAALVGLRLFPALAPQLQRPDPAVQALAAARTALGRGDRAAAGEDLEAALRSGVLDLPFADEARLLAAELGRPVPGEKPLDPPYPPLAVAGARVALARLPAATDGSGTK